LYFVEERFGKLEVATARQVQVVIHVPMTDGPVTTGRDEETRISVEEGGVGVIPDALSNPVVDGCNLASERIVKLTSRRNALKIKAQTSETSETLFQLCLLSGGNMFSNNVSQEQFEER
jgi:hypothetical protein